MDENVQHQITSACLALLQKHPVEPHGARKRTGRLSPTTKTVEAAHSLYVQSSHGSKEREQAVKALEDYERLLEGLKG